MHEIRWSSYREKDYSTVEIEEIENERARRESSSRCGLYNRIRFFTDKIFDTQEQARKFISENERADYDQLAVRYRESRQNENVIRCRERVAQCRRRFADVDSELYASGRNAEYIGCKQCGSKISRKHITSNKCPVCRAEMRNKEQLKRVESYREAVNRAVRDLNQEMKKCSTKAPVCWMVKTEIHV